MKEVQFRLRRDSRIPSYKVHKSMVGKTFEIVYRESIKLHSLSRIRKFVGICISYERRLTSSRCILRNVFKSLPVEVGFDLYSPLIIRVFSVPVYKSLPSRKAKLFLLRRDRLTRSKVYL
jgi:ribosomal protein L19